VNFPSLPSVCNYFYSFCSERRTHMVTELNEMILQSATDSFGDRLADIPELDTYELFAIDGHWHSGATHDSKSSEKKVATGHFYSLDLRRHTLRDLAVNEYHKENDMHVLKRLKPTGLRQGVARGKRVLNVYDRAGIDFEYWRRCQKECAVYFLSRVKDGMVSNGSTRWVSNLRTRATLGFSATIGFTPRTTSAFVSLPISNPHPLKRRSLLSRILTRGQQRYTSPQELCNIPKSLSLQASAMNIVPFAEKLIKALSLLISKQAHFDFLKQIRFLRQIGDFHPILIKYGARRVQLKGLFSLDSSI
jgi:hypothetical protein